MKGYLIEGKKLGIILINDKLYSIYISPFLREGYYRCLDCDMSTLSATGFPICSNKLWMCDIVKDELGLLNLPSFKYRSILSLFISITLIRNLQNLKHE